MHSNLMLLIFVADNFNRTDNMDSVNEIQKAPARKKKLDLNAPIGEVIRRIRESLRYNQADIGRMVNKSRNHISDIEAMKGFPSYSVLVDILRVLGYELTVRRIKVMRTPRKVKQTGGEVTASEPQQ